MGRGTSQLFSNVILRYNRPHWERKRGQPSFSICNSFLVFSRYLEQMNWMLIWTSIIWSLILNLMLLLEGRFCRKFFVSIIESSVNSFPILLLEVSAGAHICCNSLLLDCWCFLNVDLCNYRHSRKPWSRFVNPDNQHLVSPEVMHKLMRIWLLCYYDHSNDRLMFV